MPTLPIHQAMLTEAKVTSIKFCSTRRGDRVYTVFKTLEGQELGLWHAADSNLRLQIGDRVALKRDRQGQWQVVPRRYSHRQRSFYAQLRPSWRL